VAVTNTLNWGRKTTVQFGLLCIAFNGADLGNKRGLGERGSILGRVLYTVSQAYRRNPAAKFDELQCNRNRVANTHLQLI